VLLLLATPVRSLHLGQTDNGALPKDTQSRQSYDTMTEGFRPSSNGTMLIAVSFSKPADLDKLRNQQRKTTQQEIAKHQAKAETKIQEEATRSSKKHPEDPERGSTAAGAGRTEVPGTGRSGQATGRTPGTGGHR